MKRLRELQRVGDWTYESSSSDIAVFALQDERPRTYKADVLLPAVSPQDALAMVGQPDQWNSWFLSAKVIENLDDNTTHIYYVLQGSKDLSMVETRDASSKDILFCSTSVASLKCPPVSSAKRVSLKLSAFTLSAEVDDGVTKGTHLTWYLQAHKTALLSSLSSKKAMAKHMAASLEVLRHKLSPQETPPASISRGKGIKAFRRSMSGRHSSTPPRAGPAALLDLNGQTSRRNSLLNPTTAPSSRPSSITTAPEDSSIDQRATETVAPEAAAPAAEASRRARLPEDYIAHPTLCSEKQEAFDKLLQSTASWSKAHDADGRVVLYQEREGQLPVVRVDLDLDARGLNTEEVLGCFKSAQARRTCAPSFWHCLETLMCIDGRDAALSRRSLYRRGPDRKLQRALSACARLPFPTHSLDPKVVSLHPQPLPNPYIHLKPCRNAVPGTIYRRAARSRGPEAHTKPKRQNENAVHRATGPRHSRPINGRAGLRSDAPGQRVGFQRGLRGPSFLCVHAWPNMILQSGADETVVS
jgi:hypothetical protein